LTEFDGKLYFAADDGVNGNELWVTDGTTEGTIIVEDLNPVSTEPNLTEDFAYANSSSGVSYLTFVNELTVVGDELFFSADNGETGTELFKLTADDLNDEPEALTIESTNSVSFDRNGNSFFLGRSDDDLFDVAFGKDTLESGDGNDILALRVGDGGDTIVDFDLDIERLGLVDGLQLGDLTLNGNIIGEVEEVLANLNGIDTANLSVSNFEVI